MRAISLLLCPTQIYFIPTLVGALPADLCGIPTKRFQLSLPGSHEFLTLRLVLCKSSFSRFPYCFGSMIWTPHWHVVLAWDSDFSWVSLFFTHGLRYLANFLPTESVANVLVPVSKTTEPFLGLSLCLVLHSVLCVVGLRPHLFRRDHSMGLQLVLVTL